MARNNKAVLAPVVNQVVRAAAAVPKDEVEPLFEGVSAASDEELGLISGLASITASDRNNILKLCEVFQGTRRVVWRSNDKFERVNDGKPEISNTWYMILAQKYPILVQNLTNSMVIYTNHQVKMGMKNLSEAIAERTADPDNLKTESLYNLAAIFEKVSRGQSLRDTAGTIVINNVTDNRTYIEEQTLATVKKIASNPGMVKKILEAKKAAAAIDAIDVEVKEIAGS